MDEYVHCSCIIAEIMGIMTTIISALSSSHIMNSSNAVEHAPLGSLMEVGLNLLVAHLSTFFLWWDFISSLALGE